ncbi:MAG TPA: ribosome-associated translation inhibitor RaiA [Opitutus sp.]|nr:ribosome-associated translation inhibitor RaiA [Opitutus sp.]
MSSPSSSVRPAKLVFRGIHLDLTEAMRASLATKAERLFRHEPAIIQLRIDVACEPTRAGRTFEARGYIDIAGPDLAASTRNDDAYLAISLLIGKLDRMLRKRATAQRRHRHTEDIRVHSAELQPAGELV